MPEVKDALQGIEGLPPRLVDRYGSALLDAVARGRAIPEQELPHFPRAPRQPRDPAREDRFKLLKKWREQEAASYALAPGVLINNAVLDALAAAHPRSAAELERVVGLKRWQKAELGAGLLAVLA
jgi:ribonuclease D